MQNEIKNWIDSDIQQTDKPTIGKIITVYHGSQFVLQTPDPFFKNNNNDYGSGLYLTQDFDLAGEWAVFDRNSDGYINEYSLDLTDLNVLDLDTYPIEIWISILMQNRHGSFNPLVTDNINRFIKKYNIPIGEYDAIRGYRADDSYFTYVRNFCTNDLTLEDLKKVMRFGNLGRQICIKNEKAFNSIEFVTSHIASIDTFQEPAKNRDMVARQEYREFIPTRSSSGTLLRDLVV